MKRKTGNENEKESIDKKIAEVSHVNLNDKTIEGLRYKNKKVSIIDNTTLDIKEIMRKISIDLMKE